MQKPDYDSNLFPHWTSINVRFRDLDPLNHVNNAIFSTYYEEARIHFIQQVPQISELLGRGFSFVLANITIDFVRPVTFPAELLIGSGLLSTGNTSINSFQAIYKKESRELVSVAEASGVWYDTSAGRPSKLPDTIDFEKFMIDFNS